MSRKVIKSPRTEHDLIEHFAYIAMDKIQPADRLLAVAEEAFRTLADTPFIGRELKTRHAQLRGLRHYPLPAPYRSYIVFYRVYPDAVDIITVLHGTRDLETALLEIVD